VNALVAFCKKTIRKPVIAIPAENIFEKYLSGEWDISEDLVIQPSVMNILIINTYQEH